MELTYSLCGDYLIPNLALEDTKEYHIGKYGRMRCAYLKNHRPALYSSLLLTEKLLPHLAEVDAACALILSLLFQESGENDHRLSVGGAALRVQGGGTGAADESHCPIALVSPFSSIHPKITGDPFHSSGITRETSSYLA